MARRARDDRGWQRFTVDPDVDNESGVRFWQALADLPAARATRESVIEAQVACALVFLPLARDLHDRCGLGWPQEFEDATRRHLSKALSIELPGSP